MVDVVVEQRLADGESARIVGHWLGVTLAKLRQFIYGEDARQTAQVRFFDQRDTARGAISDLNKTRCHVLSDHLESLKRLFVDRQAEPGNCVVEVNVTPGWRGFSIEDVPEEFIADLDIDLRKEFCDR